MNDIMKRSKSTKKTGLSEPALTALGCVLFMAPLILLAYTHSPRPVWVLVFVILLFAGSLYSLGSAFSVPYSDPLSEGGEYYYDEKGIRFNTYGEELEYLWDEFIDTGLSIWTFYFKPVYYFVYFSKRPISQEDKNLIVKYRSMKKPIKNDMPIYITDYVLIPYTEQEFQRLIEVVPKWMREKLTEEKRNMKYTPCEKGLKR